MSSSGTPVRPGRGVVVPGIDTRGPAEKALAFHGLPLTPPQSAHDSRRPSLAFSALSDASQSGPSSISGYSQPVTPIHSMAQSHDFTAHWTDGVDLHASIAATMNDSCQNAHLGQSMFGMPFEHQQMSDASNMPIYPSVGQDSFASTMTASPARNAWSIARQTPSSLVAPTGLNFSQECSPATLGYRNVDQSFQQSFEQPSYSQYGPSHASLASSAFHQPQHVVPSQVNAQEDYTMDTSSAYGTGETVHGAYTQSFDSDTSGYSDFYAVGPESPMGAYFDESDPDFVHIKNEYSSPSRGTSTPRSRQLPGGYNPQRVARKNSRSAKRSRKSQHEGKAWLEQEINGIIVQCEGKPFEIKNGIAHTHESKDSKPHRCTYEDEPGNPCGSRFERTEHLKRHMSMHSRERAYKCPLPKCGKAFSRPDNTGDHFKTHLRPNAKGRRNPPFEFHVLERGIVQTYDEKTANKASTLTVHA
ncbi:Zinc finger C2H2 protein [Fulvia fulva]|uniref:C2H2 type master regulator of conidiophore development brlA n=1 Tax=Passalora fulva TaxID=5499 RepID=A0A9Q8P4T6_PASFU|nr:Zinc finger C2H2 protein [Fulvia fulva]KAK4631342.1 Zinc finger C2H2 protein [Fulvia fulva]KAK4633718.1 Zinc finger C2H2 protein [Fulvia fulva]UJO13171.1 Zinc finger C2H2 protein [Fulvia fulva]WPV10689.1 Zinc finger C2H2 protein [Fulvia fulva]WPV26647.1 Zinc finger C2H2 protein [Fulvia fulva]